eukprot:scaffold4436_cov108-Cylindrotheca_fusiformis.AAC.4
MTASNRIPQALKNVFVASQGGEDVEMIPAPEDGVCFRTYGKGSNGMLKKNNSSSYVRKSRPSSVGLRILNRAKRVTVTAAEATKVLLRQRTPIQRFMNQETASPQSFLDEELATRGYSTETYAALEGGYHSSPNALQLASFGTCLNQAVRQADTKLINQLLYCGLSPNACNKFGESIVHSVCRRGDVEALDALLAGGCCLQVSDDYGRTPLHDACWQSDNPCFDVIRRILKVDRNLIFIKDIRGATPLSYVKKENHPAWINFLTAEMDHFWPADAAANDKQSPPPLTQQQPNTRPLPSQITNLSNEVISLIAIGQLPPTNPRLLAALIRLDQPHHQQQETTQGDGDELMKDNHSDSSNTASNSYSDDEQSDDDDASEGSYDSDCSFDSDYDSDFDFEDEDISEMMVIANSR